MNARPKSGLRKSAGSLPPPAAGAQLIALLVGIIIRLDKGGHSISKMSFAGASLLGNDVGGYVLIALIAFLTGVTIAVVCYRYRKLKETQNSSSGRHDS